MANVMRIMSGARFIDRVCESQGVDPAYVRRVVIDAPFDAIVRVYIEMAGSAKMLDVDLSDIDIEVKVLDATTLGDLPTRKYIDGPFSYVCPQCGMLGPRSALDNDCCTNCANRRRGV